MRGTSYQISSNYAIERNYIIEGEEVTDSMDFWKIVHFFNLVMIFQFQLLYLGFEEGIQTQIKCKSEKNALVFFIDEKCEEFASNCSDYLFESSCFLDIFGRQLQYGIVNPEQHSHTLIHKLYKHSQNNLKWQKPKKETTNNFLKYL